MGHSAEEQEEINFFIPMVDLMVAILFIFIIIIMVLVLMVREEQAASTQSTTSSAAAVKIANESAIQQLVNDITKDTLKNEGISIELSNQEEILRTVLYPPEETRELER